MWKNILYAFLIFLLLAGIFSIFNNPTSGEEIKKISFSKLVEQIKNEKVKEITVEGSKVNVELEDGTKEKTNKQEGVALESILEVYGVSEEKLVKANISSTGSQGENWIILLNIIPFLLIILFFWWILRQSKQGANQAFSFGKANKQSYRVERKQKIGFKDIADMEEAKQEVKEVVDFLKNPRKFLKMGARIPRGVLLVGQPGTGKTLLSRAVASEANVPFFTISGSEFVEMFVGVGASRVRDLFNTAKKNAPSIIFLDELDAIGRSRGSGVGGGHDEKEQTLNQILSEMDGFERDTGVIVLAATNRPDTLDPALLRPGRFDRRIIFELPDIKGREEILTIHAKKKPKTSDVKLREIAERTPGFSGADLDNLVNEAAILAARRNKKKISQKEFIESIEKVILGPQRKSHILNENEKKIAAYHEAGHALVSSFTPETETVRKVSIVSRGMAAGYTLKLPVEEKHLKNKTQFKSELATLLAGYTAEKIVFNEVTTGASDDLKNATKLSQKLVMEYGMSKLGPITFGKKEDLIFLGKEITEERNFSEEVAKKIDKEVDRFVKEAADKARSILEEKRDVLDKLAQKLIEKETVERDEFEKLIGKKIEEKKSTPATKKTAKQNRTKSNRESSKSNTRNRKSSRESGKS